MGLSLGSGIVIQQSPGHWHPSRSELALIPAQVQPLHHPSPSWARTLHLEHRILSPWQTTPEEQLGTLVALSACCPIALSPLPFCSVAKRVGLKLGAGYSQKLPESLVPCWGLSERAPSLGRHWTLGVDFQNGEAWAERRRCKLPPWVNWAADCS